MTGNCPSCGEPVGAADGFCEACGIELQAPAVSAPGKDHGELDVGLAAGVTDRGLRHSRNEDAMALAATRRADGLVALAVVCDGVSSAPRADEASLTAASAAVRELLSGVRAGDDPADASRAAVRTGGNALTGLADQAGAPAATYVSAVVGADAVTVCWLGDSRVYWLSQEPAASACLTKDDSLAEEIVEAGLASPEEAMASPHAHVITRWLGADLPDPEPHVTRFSPAGPGVVLLCSDGLWNYRPDASDLAAMALPGALTNPLATAAALVKFAVDAGGIDNVTVVLVPFPLASTGTPPEGEPSAETPTEGESDTETPAEGESR
jgi:serine/threonine protein phosphatase PrpC